MADSPVLYYITDRTQFAGEEQSRRRQLLAKIAEAARAAIDFIQLREKDLSPRDVEQLAREALATISENSRGPTKLLINSRSDIALAIGADGVHLRSDDFPPSAARAIATTVLARDPKPRSWTVGVSCHSEEDVSRAASDHADYVVFAPVFQKKGVPQAKPAGFDNLQRASQYRIPVFALGGVTMDNAASCLRAGAAGIAGIRLFQNNDITEVVRRIRGH
jgi:thiamine-phosphate pyrophosphorylase